MDDPDQDVFFHCDGSGNYYPKSCIFSWQGAHHLKNNSPRQDRVAMASLTKSSGKLVVVADGLGACKFSHLGAQRAVDVMQFQDWLKRWDKLLHDDKTTPKDFDKCFCEQVEYINKLLTNNAKLNTESLKGKLDYATTLLVAAVNEKRIYAAMVGDGGIFRVKNNNAELLTKPAETGASNIVVPITHSQWEKRGFKSYFKKIDSEDSSYICLMTDGFSEPISSPTEYFQFFTGNLKKIELCKMDSWFKELAKYYEDECYSDDDKSLALVFLKDSFLNNCK